MIITIIAGARPNFMKIAPIIHAIQKAQSGGASIQYRLVHTGQHYDNKLSDTFFRELNIPEPDANLEVGSGSQAVQTATIMIRFEDYLLSHPCDLVMVVGDVNSTMACSIVAKKMNIDVAHVEAGIRSYDMEMPEEINRMVTDAISDHFFTTSEVAGQNLLKAGVDKQRIHFVGNTMIDSLMENMERIRRPAFWEDFALQAKDYIVLTLHRPSNVDDPKGLKALLQEILDSIDSPVVFPVHPRTLKNLDASGIRSEKLKLAQPMGYLEFIYMLKNARAVITDSGGIQEETTVLGIPCITLRNNTERPETVTTGTNEVIGTELKAIRPAIEKLLGGQWKKGGIPELWDGKTSGRIVAKLLSLYAPKATTV